MGHRLTALELPEDLRQWREAGLELVFPDAAFIAAAEASEQTSVAPRPAPEPEPVCDFADAPDDASHNVSVPTPEPASAPAAPRPPAPAYADDDPMWPAPWNRWLSKVRSPCRVVLTYWELAVDYGEAPDDARRALWRSMINCLPWPQGSVSYWPLSEPSAEGLTPNPYKFWQGVLEFQASTVLCFGRRAASTLLPGMPFGYKTITAGQYRILLLPGPEDMLPDNKRVKGIAWNMLKDYEP